MSGPQILCLGKDISLLQTRQMVLQTRYFATYCATVRDAKERWPVCAFDILLLCHTVTDEEVEAAHDYAQTARPPAALLQMHAGQVVRSARIHRAVRNLEGPEPLLRAIHEILQHRAATGTC